MWVFGRRAVIEALRSEINVERILIEEGLHPPQEIIYSARHKNIPVKRVPKVTLFRMFRDQRHQGVAAYVASIPFADIEEMLLRTVKESGILLFVDHLEDPQNLGNILRSAEAFSLSGVILPKRRASPISDTVVKASQGAVFFLQIARVSSLLSELKRFQKMGGWVYALDLEGPPIQDVDFNFPLALIVGSEGKGVSRSLLNVADDRVKIEMRGRIESLNAATALGIALFWVSLRRDSRLQRTEDS